MEGEKCVEGVRRDEGSLNREAVRGEILGKQQGTILGEIAFNLNHSNNSTNPNRHKKTRSNEQSNKVGTLRIAHINVRGMSFDEQEEIKDTLQVMNINVCCLTETHRNIGDDLGKYKVYSGKKWAKGYSGGVTIPARNNLDIVEVEGNEGINEGSEVDVGWTEINRGQDCIIIGSVYIPPVADSKGKGVMEAGFQALIKQKEYMDTLGHPVILLGDFNAHMDGECEKCGGVKPNGAGTLLRRWIQENMVILNHEEFCEGKWTREENDIQSVTDYILCNGGLIDKVDKMVIVDEGKLQIWSDHIGCFVI